MANNSGAISGAMSGAQTGAMFGPWGMAIGAIAGGILGNKQDKAKQKAINQQKQNILTNSYKSMFELATQHTLENQRTSEALQDYKNQGRLATSQINAQYGASDVIGSSADSLKQALNYQTQQAEQSVWANHSIGIENHNSAVNSIYEQTKGQLKQVDAQAKGGDSGQQGMGQLGGLLSTGLSAYSQYKGGGGGDTGFLQQFQSNGSYSGGRGFQTIGSTGMSQGGAMGNTFMSMLSGGG